MKSSYKVMIVVALILVVSTFLGDQLGKMIAMEDTCGITVGTTKEEFNQIISEDAHLDYGNYSFFVSDSQYPVLVRFEQEKAVEVKVIDASMIRPTAERFATLTQGTSIDYVTKAVGLPIGISENVDNALKYFDGKETYYTIVFEEVDGLLQVKEVIMPQADAT